MTRGDDALSSRIPDVVYASLAASTSTAGMLDVATSAGGLLDDGYLVLV